MMTILTPQLAEVVEKIQNLQRLTQSTGFKTNRSQGELLANLTPDELSAVSAALQK
ncbi:MAG: hypothetical protein WCA76_13065 [Candidatus Sulfotelmatobacter sp.]|jgi:hypothetical protein